MLHSKHELHITGAKDDRTAPWLKITDALFRKSQVDRLPMTVEVIGLLGNVQSALKRWRWEGRIPAVPSHRASSPATRQTSRRFDRTVIFLYDDCDQPQTERYGAIDWLHERRPIYALVRNWCGSEETA